MDTQPKEAHKDMYKETTEEIVKGNSSEGQSISPPSASSIYWQAGIEALKARMMISFMYLKPLLVVLLIH